MKIRAHKSKIVMAALALIVGAAFFVFAYNQRQGIKALEKEVSTLKSELKSTQQDLTQEKSCHKQANILARNAEQLLVDLYAYGDDWTFLNDVDTWVADGESYNKKCLQSVKGL